MSTNEKQSDENANSNNGKPKATKKRPSATSNASLSAKATTAKNQTEKADPIEKMYFKIGNILKESNESISSHISQYNQIALDLEEGLLKAHDEYSEKLNEIYKTRSVKLSELNEKYDYDLYKAKEFYDYKNNDSVASRIYNSILGDKKSELTLIDNEINEKIINNKKKYNEKIALLNKTGQDNRNNINHVDYLEEIKTKINELLEELSHSKNKKEGGSGVVSKTEGKPIKSKK